MKTRDRPCVVCGRPSEGTFSSLCPSCQRSASRVQAFASNADLLLWCVARVRRIERKRNRPGIPEGSGEQP